MAGRSNAGGPPSPDRRKLLVAGGFAVTSFLLLRELPDTEPARARPAARPRPSGPPAVAGAANEPGPDHVFDTIIAGGRVMDPDSGFDQVANVGIDGATVTKLSDEPLQGRYRIDAKGRVVAPGFIDILSYEPNDYGIWYKIADGVTTNLAMHGINGRAEDFFATYSGASPAHFGGAWDNPYFRGAIEIGGGESATEKQIADLADTTREELEQGWIGLDFEPEYTPGIEPTEINRLAAVGVEYGVASYFHGRYSDNLPPGTNADTLAEILQTARETGAAVHVQHINSTGGTFSMVESIDTLMAARDEGIDVTACLYPYDYWATYAGATRWDPDPESGATFEERFRITYDDLQVAGTDERGIDPTTFQSLRQPGENPLVAALDSIPDDDIVAALQAPFTIIGSDAILEPGDNNHPRATGCFARTLGVYVRERKVLGLMEALAKMTILPARRVEGAAPAMQKKGRLQRGADADITIFDPDTIADRSTIVSPGEMSVGIDWVLVDGQAVKTPDMTEPDHFERSVVPGRAITRRA